MRRGPALLTDGDLSDRAAATRFLFLRQQQADGSMPRNSLVNGKTAPDSFQHPAGRGGLPDPDGLPVRTVAGVPRCGRHIRRAADFLVSHGPSFGPERWEEQGGYSPSTIAAEIAGLVAGAHIATVHHDAASARVWLATADRYQRSIKSWTVTTNGPLSTKPYFIRLSKDGDPNAATTYSLGNGSSSYDQRTIIDAGLPRARPPR